eukprot:4521614-Pyramimonas_sp.AAC.1
MTAPLIKRKRSNGIPKHGPMRAPGGGPCSYAPRPPPLPIQLDSRPSIIKPETPDPRARSPRERRSERGGPRAQRPRSNASASDLSNLSGRSSALSMRINAK